MLRDEHELSQTSVDFLRSWTGVPPARLDITDDALYAFATGLSSEAEAAVIASVLIESPVDRQRLIQIRREFDALASSQAPMAGALTEWLSKQLNRSLRFFGHLHETCSELTWKGLAELKEHQASLAAVGRTLSLRSALPTSATVRGVTDSPSETPGGADPNLHAEILSDGSLVVHAMVEAAETLVGWQLCLELIDPAGGYIPIGCEAVTADGWRLVADGFGQITGLPVGHLSASLFRLSPPSAPPPLHQGNYIYVEVQDETPTTFELAEEPRLESGELVVTLGCSAFRRERFKNYRLELSIPIGTHLHVIGTWPMSGWQGELQTFRVPVPGSSDGRLELGSVLHVRLVLL